MIIMTKRVVLVRITAPLRVSFIQDVPKVTEVSIVKNFLNLTDKCMTY